MDISNLNLPELSQSDSAFESRYFTKPNLNSLTAESLECAGNPKKLGTPNLPAPKLQCGGSFNKIIDPISKKQFRLNSKKGKRILKKYLFVLTGGAGLESIFNPNMLTRKFDCNQPNWEPVCI